MLDLIYMRVVWSPHSVGLVNKIEAALYNVALLSVLHV